MVMQGLSGRFFCHLSVKGSRWLGMCATSRPFLRSVLCDASRRWLWPGLPRPCAGREVITPLTSGCINGAGVGAGTPTRHTAAQASLQGPIVCLKSQPSQCLIERASPPPKATAAEMRRVAHLVDSTPADAWREHTRAPDEVQTTWVMLVNSGHVMAYVRR